MKGGISFAEIRAIAKFLSVYEGGYIEKNYVGGNGIAFKFRKSGINSTYLHVMGNEFLFLGEENLIDGKKNLIPVENMPIDSVEQVGTDRILEINREINTIGSKGGDLTIARVVVEAKSELEKIREQVQNIE